MRLDGAFEVALRDIRGLRRNIPMTETEKRIITNARVALELRVALIFTAYCFKLETLETQKSTQNLKLSKFIGRGFNVIYLQTQRVF